MEGIEAALGFEAMRHLIAVALPVRLDEHRHHLLQVFFLIACEVAHRQALELAIVAAEAHARFVGQTLAQQRSLLLLAVEHLVELVGGYGLRPEYVAGVRRAFVE